MSLWIGARNLDIRRSEDPRYWKWVSDHSGEELAELLDLNWLEINVTVDLKKLLIKTSYSAYLVFKLTEDRYGLTSAKAQVMYVSGEKRGQRQGCTVFVDREKSPGERGRFPQARGEGWMELKLGEFFNDLGDGKVNVGLSDTYPNNWKSGLVVRGIELRPNYY